MKIAYAALFLLFLAAFSLLFGSPVRLEKEMAGKTQKKSQTAKPDAFRIGDAEVVITQTDVREIVQINGRVEPYFKTDGGYRLKRDVYQKPAKSLRSAVERYLKAEEAR